MRVTVALELELEVDATFKEAVAATQDCPPEPETLDIDAAVLTDDYGDLPEVNLIPYLTPDQLDSLEEAVRREYAYEWDS